MMCTPTLNSNGPLVLQRGNCKFLILRSLDLAGYVAFLCLREILAVGWFD